MDRLLHFVALHYANFPLIVLPLNRSKHEVIK